LRCSTDQSGVALAAVAVEGVCKMLHLGLFALDGQDRGAVDEAFVLLTTLYRALERRAQRQRRRRERAVVIEADLDTTEDDEFMKMTVAAAAESATTRAPTRVRVRCRCSPCSLRRPSATRASV
jgi:hypothetical protein